MTDEVIVSEVVSSDDGSRHVSDDNDSVESREPAERMVPQSKVNEIVGSVKKSTYDKAYQDALSRVEAERPKQNTESINIDEKVNRIVEEKLKQVREAESLANQNRKKAENWNRTLESLKPKIDMAAEKYEDFEEATNIDFSKLQYLLEAADTVDNSGDVLYHLCKSPTKFREMARDLKLEPGDPVRDMALRDLRDLSTSLKNNETARNKTLPRAPLSQIKPSNVGADNGGKPTMADLRRKFTV